MTLTLLTAQDVHDKLVDIIARHPDAVNPTAAGFCLYTDPLDPDRHCIVGQLAAEQGWALPRGGLRADHAAAHEDWPVTGHAALYLTDVQVQADGRASGAPAAPVPWGSVTLPPVPAT